MNGLRRGLSTFGAGSPESSKQTIGRFSFTTLITGICTSLCIWAGVPYSSKALVTSSILKTYSGISKNSKNSCSFSHSHCIVRYVPSAL
jgi:hypothetical protein